jgi:DNA-binding response OmpR family regulator
LKVLLVDDDPDLLDVTAYALRRKGFTVILAGDGAHAIRRWQTDNPDVVVLDVGMPRMNGFEVCHRIRQESTTPVILLTALGDEESVLQGFRVGADDYVTKPFSPQQLIARIQAVWRRGRSMGQHEPVRQIQIGDLLLDSESHEVRRGGVEVQMTPREFRILFLLASNLDRVVSFSRLVDYAWGYNGGDPALLKTHISHIRSKLGLAVKGPGAIVVVPTVGYKLTSLGEAESDKDSDDGDDEASSDGPAARPKLVSPRRVPANARESEPLKPGEQAEVPAISALGSQSWQTGPIAKGM